MWKHDSFSGSWGSLAPLICYHFVEGGSNDRKRKKCMETSNLSFLMVSKMYRKYKVYFISIKDKDLKTKFLLPLKRWNFRSLIKNKEISHVVFLSNRKSTGEYVISRWCSWPALNHSCFKSIINTKWR